MNKFILACLVLVTLYLAGTDAKKYKMMRLNEQKFLEFRKERKTVVRSPTSELVCIDSYNRYLCNLFAPTYVRCENVSYPSKVVAWECKADLYPKIEFDRYDVLCDIHPDYHWDDVNNVIEGSCYLNFSLRKPYYD